MSHLRAPAAPADRREGGRHGRPVARLAPVLPEAQIRPQLLRLAVLPPIAVALSGCAAVLFTVRSTDVRPSLTLWAVLAGAVFVTLAGILIAAVAAGRAARSVHDRVGALRRSTARREADLRALVEALRRGDGPPQRKARVSPPEDLDDFELLAADLARAHDGAVAAVVQASQLSSQAGSEQKLEVFVNLARRLQSLVHREISILDDLENEIEDPDLLKGLFHVDHLATRIRRHAENLAVLGGAVSRRQWSIPVSTTEVLRSAIAEVEQYSRVKLVPPIDGELRGHAVADVIHLLAELVENATVFSAPHTQVLLRANLVTSGLAVEVEDRGLGMPAEEQNRMNALLADPDQVNVGRLLADGRIGLFVVSQLARRHGITVRLQTNIYGGVQAVLVVPQALLGTAPGAPLGVAQPRDGAGAGAGAGVARPAGPPWQHAQPASGPGAGPRAGTSHGRGPAPVPASGTSSASGSATAPGSPTASGAGSAYTPGSGGAFVPEPGTPDGSRRQRREAARETAAAPEDGGPATLPVRGANGERPNPAEAVPGIRPDDRRILAENVAAPPTPLGGTVRGIMGKPQLPRRRAQEHIAPQLRGRPAPRQDTEYLAAHDTGLMAAFQRGIGLAEAQQHTDPGHMGPGHMDPGHVDSGHRDSCDRNSGHIERGLMQPGHGEAAHSEPTYRRSGPIEPTHVEPTHVEPSHVEPSHVEPTHVEPSHSERLPREPIPIEPARTAEVRPAHVPAPLAPPEPRGEGDGLPALRPDQPTARHDGSTAAG